MHRPKSALKRAAAVAVALAAVASSLVAPTRPAFTDDTDLLRFNTAKPYLFILLDTSASMSLAPDNSWVHANGDDPRSKLYSAKKVLYEVFEDVDDVHFGFGTLNQDELRVSSKHWLYYSQTTGATSGWPFTYLGPDLDGPIRVDPVTGQQLGDIENGVDILAFGPHFTGSSGVAGTCAAPLSFATQREKINRFSKLDGGSGTSTIWIEEGNRVYRLKVTRPGNKPDGSPNAQLGRDDMHVAFELARVGKVGNTHLCGISPIQPTIDQTYPTANVKLRLWTEFLMLDEDRGPVANPGGAASGTDGIAGFWNAQDVKYTADCTDPHPFSGIGWEGNYDTTSTPANRNDPFCLNEADPATCFTGKFPTTTDPRGRPLDRGDVIPFDWLTENRDSFLRRLAPNHGSGGPPEFRSAPFFADSPDANGVLPLLAAARKPMLAGGATPLGKAVVDFRCWYLGEGNKCKDSVYDTIGWESIARAKDSEFGCRRPYLIVISDGDDNCAGENPCADTANLNSRGEVRTWVIAYGKDCSKAGNPLKCMAQNGKGELVCPQNPQQLKDELQRILGEIREEARSFASAAVPSVQAIVEDKVFLTNFTPLNGEAVWEGHVHSFLKPLPLDDVTGRPRTDIKCSTLPADRQSACHVWDAGQVMATSQLGGLGEEDDDRRVFYARRDGDGTLERQLLAATPVPANPATAADIAIKRDLWQGLGISFTAPESDTSAWAKANTVINKTYALKEATVTSTDPKTGSEVTRDIEYVLGDIFHSNPLVMGAPSNTFYFAADLNGYRAFSEKQKFRRKLLLVGSNDGMLHAFDAGIFRNSVKKFDNGTGKEVFAYVPRATLPVVRQLTEDNLHKWGVDASVTAADVFIDPLHDGTPDEDEREWRTVVIGGLREGGSAYYALDLTQPDTLASGIPQVKGTYVPTCSGLASFDEDKCGPLPFPAPLWEFNDSLANQLVPPLAPIPANKLGVRLDEEDLDGNGVTEGNDAPDLGFTWSVPNIGRIRLTEDGATVEKYVAIFGGGFDAASKTTPQEGTWLYMVDIETGKVLYKRKLQGAAPSEPAAVDTNQDGFIDRIYVGTTAGILYRVDLKADSTGAFPELAEKDVRGTDGLPYTVLRIPDTAWSPRPLFDTGFDQTTPVLDRPIYFRPSVIFVAQLGRYALSFGAGDREDLWSSDLQPGRFYVFVDDSDDLTVSGTLPFNESKLARVEVNSALAASQFLLSRPVGQRGWYMVLDPDERVITDPFALSGVTFFSTFKPDVDVDTRNKLCSKGGFSRVFIVNTVNANAFMKDANNLSTRFLEVSTFVTNPYTEQGQTKNPEGTADRTADDLDERLSQVMASLKGLFPANCKFANYRIDIKTVSADTGVVFIAPVPVCIVEKNWREF